MCNSFNGKKKLEGATSAADIDSARAWGEVISHVVAAVTCSPLRLAFNIAVIVFCGLWAQCVYFPQNWPRLMEYGGEGHEFEQILHCFSAYCDGTGWFYTIWWPTGHRHSITFHFWNDPEVSLIENKNEGITFIDPALQLLFQCKKLITGSQTEGVAQNESFANKVILCCVFRLVYILRVHLM